jgi:ATP-dependent DNA ligase
VAGALNFEALQLRLHPAESRVRRLAGETPAILIAFDCLVMSGRVLLDRPLSERREVLEQWFATADSQHVRLSPFTLERETAEAGWPALGVRSTE